MKKDEMIKKMESFSGKYSPYTVFYDFVTMSALAVQNGCWTIHDEIWEKREELYKQTMKKYEKKEQIVFVEMFELLAEALEENIEDVLGYVYMRSGCYNKDLGQFFTPFHLSKLTAEICIPDIVDENEVVEINEPSSGGGGMIIGYAAALKEKGIDYQKIMKVTAQDLDWLGVYMSYLQFSLLGIDAEVAQGNTLTHPYTGKNKHSHNVFMTPRRIGAII